jgi:hypothetical protein
VVPVEYMGIKVPFDKNQLFMGTIVKVNNLVDGKGKSKKDNCHYFYRELKSIIVIKKQIAMKL